MVDKSITSAKRDYRASIKINEYKGHRRTKRLTTAGKRLPKQMG